DDCVIDDVIASEVAAPSEEAVTEAMATMLIVEDNVELRSVMARMFSRKFRVLQAGDGAQALSVVKGDRVDIIISDVMMPVMDGLEFARELKRDVNTSHIPVILLTAKNRVEDRVECYRAGADAYIAKPFEMSVLEARIDSFLRQKLQRQLEFQSAEKVNAESLDLSDLDRQLLDKIIAYVEENIAESDLDVKSLGERFCMSKATFYRKIKNLTDLSPADFVRNLRLKHACSMLQQGKSVTDTAFACGFSSPKYFSTCFKAQYGVSPKDFK
ncbi:MAG: response regulator, partial [Muribaculaceae bacterium]|nr:response regulator [Muribaculaceae bacterium]